MASCRMCGNEFDSNYCPKCGSASFDKNLEKLELKLKKRYKIYKISFIPLIVVSILAIFCVVFFRDKYPLLSLVFILIMITPSLYGMFGNKLKDKYNLTFKKEYVKYSPLSKIPLNFPGYTYDFEKGISRDIIYETDIINYGKKFESSGLVTGEYKDIKFEISNTKISVYVQDNISDGPSARVSVIPIFNGSILMLTVPENFETDLLFSPAYFCSNRIDKFICTKGLTLSAVRENFQVYTRNEDLSGTIISPQTFQIISKLEQDYDDSLVLLFQKNHIFVCLYNKELLKVPILLNDQLAILREKNYNVLNPITNDMDFIKKLLDDLQIDNGLYIEKSIKKDID